MTLDDYIDRHTTVEDPILRDLTRQTHLRMVQPRMISGHVQGQLLTMLIRMQKPLRALELGTFTGYSAICIAKGMERGAILHTIDMHDEMQDFVADYLDKAGVADRVTQHFGRALDVMNGFSEPFDFVFLDADKREYPTYYNTLFDRGLVHGGSLIVADNTLWDGHVLNDGVHKTPHTQAIMNFNDIVASDNRVEVVMLPLRDGLSVIQVKN